MSHKPISVLDRIEHIASEAYNLDAPTLEQLDEALLRIRDTARNALDEQTRVMREQERISKLCKVCWSKPQTPGLDHCSGPDCIPF